MFLCTSGFRFGYHASEDGVSQRLLIAALSNCLISHSCFARAVGVVCKLQMFVHLNSAYVNAKLYSVLRASFLHEIALPPFFRPYFAFN